MSPTQPGQSRTMAPAVFFATCAMLAGCGPIKAGSSSPNDPAPNATIIAQGTFTSLNGQTVTGAAIVYETGGSSYIVRLSGISAPAENGLQVVVVANGTTQATFALRAPTGSQNYSMSMSAYSVYWNQVNIHSSVNDEDYGEALLTMTQ